MELHCNGVPFPKDANLTVGEPKPPAELAELCLETRNRLVEDLARRMGITTQEVERIHDEANRRLFGVDMASGPDRQVEMEFDGKLIPISDLSYTPAYAERRDRIVLDGVAEEQVTPVPLDKPEYYEGYSKATPVPKTLAQLMVESGGNPEWGTLHDPGQFQLKEGFVREASPGNHAAAHLSDAGREAASKPEYILKQCAHQIVAVDNDDVPPIAVCEACLKQLTEIEAIELKRRGHRLIHVSKVAPAIGERTVWLRKNGPDHLFVEPETGFVKFQKPGGPVREVMSTDPATMFSEPLRVENEPCRPGDPPRNVEIPLAELTGEYRMPPGMATAARERAKQIRDGDDLATPTIIDQK